MAQNPTTIISTVRHGKKHSDGNLLPEGKFQSAHKALDINHLEGDVILFHSGEARVKDTIQVIGGNLHKQTPEELENILETEHDLQDYVVPSLHFLKKREVKSEYFSNWHEETNEEILSKFLDGDIPDEPGFTALAMAKNLAQVISTEIQFSLLTDSSTKTNFINGSHEPVIMSFLYYALNNFTPTIKAEDFLKVVGGSVRYTEGFDVFIEQSDDNLFKINIYFRGKIYPTTLREIQKFSQSLL